MYLKTNILNYNLATYFKDWFKFVIIVFEYLPVCGTFQNFEKAKYWKYLC